MSDLAVLDPRAAFVDVGSEQMHVSIAGGPPEVFGTVTSQLDALRDWLLARQVRSVAMQTAGLEVSMVNGRQTRNLPGRKTDMKDCQWGATLHAHGLLRAGFVPPAHIRRLQDDLRLRAEHIGSAAAPVQHMQKALERMNVKLHDLISSLSGASGLALVRAILDGERDPERVLALCETQIRRAKAKRVKQSLRGTWAEEHLFALSQALQSWEHDPRQIAQCDRQVQALLQDIHGEDDRPESAKAPKPRKRPGVNRAPDRQPARHPHAEMRRQ